MSDVQPSGTVTLVFTDVEGSTKLLDELGADSYRDALGEHRRVVWEAFGARQGYEVDYEETPSSTRSPARNTRYRR